MRNKPSSTYSIATVSSITEVNQHTLRYWEREFNDFLSPARTKNGQRRYSPFDVSVVFKIKRLLRDEMYSLKGARNKLAKELGKILYGEIVEAKKPPGCAAGGDVCEKCAEAEMCLALEDAKDFNS